MNDKSLYTQNDETLELDFQLIRYLWKKNLAAILCFTVVCLAIGSFISLYVHQDQYTSHATILLNPSAQPNVVTNFNLDNSFFKGFSINDNPFKNQEELLRSRYIAKKVIDKLKAQHAVPSIKHWSELTDKVVEARQVPSTAFIRIQVTWHNAKESQIITQAYLDAYQEFSDEISHSSLVKQHHLLQQEVVKAETDLKNTSEKIRIFQEDHGIVDINREEGIILGQLDSLKKETMGTEATMVEKEGEIAKLKEQLGLDTHMALISVAKGQNMNYANLIADLNKIEQDYNVKALTYAPTNPEIIRMGEKIAVLKEQITKQEMLTVGRKPSGSEIVIMDDVRRELVRRLAVLEAEYSSLKNKFHINQRQLSETATDANHMPSEQETLSYLQYEHKNKEDILNRLKQNLAEVLIKETSAQSKLQLIDSPSLPQRPIFPSRFHLILLTFLTSLLLPSGIVVSYKYLTSQVIRPSFIENELKIPVLSLLTKPVDKCWSSNNLNLSGVTSPIKSKNYQDLVLNLKIQGFQQNRKAFGFSSICSEEEDQLTFLSNIAYYLAQGGDKVVIVDGNSRNLKSLPQLTNEHYNQSHLAQLADNLFSLVTSASGDSDLFPLIQDNLLPTNISSQVFYLNIGADNNAGFNLSASKGFETLIASLKGYFDWVLFASPPMLKDMESVIALRNIDGIVLMVEQQATKQQLEVTVNKAYQINTPIIGVIMKDLAVDEQGHAEFYYTAPSSV